MRNSKKIIIALSVGVVSVFLLILLYPGNRIIEKNNTEEKQDTTVIVVNTLDISSDELTYGPRTEEINQFMKDIHYTEVITDESAGNNSMIGD